MNNIAENKRFSFLAELSNMRSAIMGIAILWIMLFHSGIEAPDNIVLRALWYLFVSFGGGVGVNLFFILSGFGLYYSVSKYSDADKVDWWMWMKKRLVRLIPSYLIVSITWYLMKGDLSLYNILQLNFWIDGVRDFWFIPGILVCYFLFPVIYAAAKKWGYGKTTIALLLILVVGNILFEAFSSHFSKIEIFTWRIPCFVVGVYLGYLSKVQPKYNKLLVYGVLLAALAACFVFTGMSRASFLVGTVCFLSVLTGLLWGLKKLAPPTQTILGYFGTRSLQIYLLHVSVVPLALTMVWHFNLLLYFVVTFIVGELLYQLTSLIKVKSKKQ